MKLLTILQYASAASASVVQFCTGFEGRTDKFTPVFEVSASHKSTSVLIAQLTDFKREFMNRFDLDVEERMPDSLYPICTEETEKTTDISTHTVPGLVDMFESSDILEGKLVFPMNNTRLSQGEKLTYEVTTSGIYCALAYQPGTEEVEGVDFMASHAYGDYNLTAYLYTKLLLAVFASFLLCYITVCVFPETSKNPLNAIWNVIKYVSMGKITIWSIHNFYKLYSFNDPPYIPLANPWFYLDHLLSVLLLAVPYSFLHGIFSLAFNDVGYFTYDLVYISNRSLTSMLIAFVVPLLGQGWVQSTDSLFVNVSMTDVSVICLALLFSTDHGCHFEDCTHRSQNQRADPEEFKVGTHNGTPFFEDTCLKDGGYQEHVGLDSDLERMGLNSNRKLYIEGCTSGTYSVLKFLYVLLLFYYYQESHILHHTFRDNIHCGHALESLVSYQHVIGLNVCLNEMLEIMKRWYGAT